MNKIFNICILILVILIIFQICQFESYEDFVGDKNKLELINRINDKLVIINDKMNNFDNVKPIKSSAYQKLFETDIPEHLKKTRGASNLNRHVFDISQQSQDSKIKNMDNEVDKLTTLFNNELPKDTNLNKIKSITSHIDGKNLNLIDRGEYHAIPVNNGCLFVINNDTGIVDYDITNINRTDKHKYCLADNKQQQFRMSKIDNLDDYKKIVGSSINDRPMDDNMVEYPFYSLQPRDDKLKHMCLQSETNNITIQPCNYNKKQRWKGNNFKKPCHL